MSYAFPHSGITPADIRLCVTGVINFFIEVVGHHGQFLNHVLQGGFVHTGLIVGHQRNELAKNGDERARSCPAGARVFQSFTNIRNDDEKMDVPSVTRLGTQGNAAHIYRHNIPVPTRPLHVKSLWTCLDLYMYCQRCLLRHMDYPPLSSIQPLIGQRFITVPYSDL